MRSLSTEDGISPWYPMKRDRIAAQGNLKPGTCLVISDRKVACDHVLFSKDRERGWTALASGLFKKALGCEKTHGL